jgi:hypothetical protein
MSNWVDEEHTKSSKSVLSILQQMVDATNGNRRLDHKLGGLKIDDIDITAYTGGSLASVEGTLTGILGNPVSIQENRLENDDLIGKNIIYKHNVSVCFLPHRSNGISISFPKKDALEIKNILPEINSVQSTTR